MTGYTANLAIPYPEDSDLITDSAAICQEMAERIELLLPTVAAGTVEPSTSTYNVAEYEIARLQVSGTYTVPDLMGDGTPTLWDVVIVSGGSPSLYNGGATTWGYGGGNGGHARLWRSVKMQPGAQFDVVIGGQESGSSFGSLSVPAEQGAAQPEPYGVRPHSTYNSNADGAAGSAGCQIVKANSAGTVGVCGSGSQGAAGDTSTLNRDFYGGTAYDGGGTGGRGGRKNSPNLCAGGGTGTLGGGGGGPGGGGSGTTHVHGPGLGGSGAVLLFASVPAP